MAVLKACSLMLLFTRSLCFPVKLSATDCGASQGHYQSFDVVPSTPHTGQVFKVTNHLTFDQDISGGQFDVKVTALGALQLKHQTGPLCGFDTSYDVYLALVKVASVTVYGMECPIAKGPADLKYDIKLSPILPPALGDASFHFTAKDAMGNDVACIQAKLSIQLEDSSDNAETAIATTQKSSSDDMLTLKASDCGSSGTHAPILDFGSSGHPLPLGQTTTLPLGQTTTLTGHGQLDEQVTVAKYELTMMGQLGVILECHGDASAPKTCPLPTNFGSLTLKPMTFPLTPGKVAVNVDMDISAETPTVLQTATTTAKAIDQNGNEIFCIQIQSAPADSAIQGTMVV